MKVYSKMGTEKVKGRSKKKICFTKEHLRKKEPMEKGEYK